MMTKRDCLYATILTVNSLMLVGCMPTFTVEELKEQMPERPVELDKLDMFLGDWELTSEIRFAVLDEVLDGKGTSITEWTLDNTYIVEHAEYHMGELGKMKGAGLWTYDPKAKKFRTWWFDSQFGTRHGTATYCEKNRTWTFKAKGRGPMGKSIAKGTATFVDDDTVEWTWTERDGTGLFKVVEITGTNKRK